MIKNDINIKYIMISLFILNILSCNIFPTGILSYHLAPEIEIDIAWQIPMNSPGQGYVGVFHQNMMYHLHLPESKVITINLDNHEIVNEVQLDSISAITKSGDYIYVMNHSSFNSPKIHIFNIDGSKRGYIPLDDEYGGSALSLFSHDKYIYWRSLYNEKQAFLRIDTSKILLLFENICMVEIEVLYPADKNYFCSSDPTFYDGKIYKPVAPIDLDVTPCVTRILVFDEETGILEKEIDLDEDIGGRTSGTTLRKSENEALIFESKVDLSTGKIISKDNHISLPYAPPIIIGNELYSSSSAYSYDSKDWSSLLKLDLTTLKVKWYYQHQFSCGSQPQVVNGIVYLTAPDMILLIDADTGRVLAKDPDLHGHTIQQANSYIYNGEMIFHDGYNITAIKTNWKNTFFGVVKDNE